ncbi:MAG TPA: YhjD/YihY/BrkB family envelope integrity protein [Sedimentisphaerales bacterium]|nr:YhjD/YihY/BrkB family envelope integrity protein [Sedimentisphaerales bacterium]
MRILTDLLMTPAANLGRAGRFVVFQYKLWAHCLRLLKKNRAEQLAAALSYYTVFGIVPLAIVAVLIFNSFPAYRQTGEQVKKLIYDQLRLTQIEYPSSDKPEENVVLTEYLDQIIDRFFEGLNKGSLGLVSAILVIWAALRLLSLIETAFNHMWHVPKGRRFLQQVINYWALLTLGPLLLAVGLYATTRFTLFKTIESGPLASLGPVISFLVSATGLFLLYLVMPNAKVKAGPALWGAAVAALVWSLAKWGFGVYVLRLIPYSAIYGVLGLIPLAVFWVYVTWMIVLFGLQLTFAVQHFVTLESAEKLLAKETDVRFIANEMTGIAVAREIAAAFETDQGPLSTDALCSRLDIPGEFGQRLLDELVNRGLLGRTTEPNPGYVLVRDPARIRLSEIAEAVAAGALAQPKPETHGNLHRIAQTQRTALAQYSLRDVLGNIPTNRQERDRAQSQPRQETAPVEDPLQ